MLNSISRLAKLVNIQYLNCTVSCQILDKFTDRSVEPKKNGSLIDWPTMQAKFPWSIVLLLGGSFALAEGVKTSGLSALVGKQLHAISGYPLVLVQTFCILLSMCITSVTSNTVTASILIPIVNGLVRLLD